MGFLRRLWRIITGRANDAADALENANFESVVRQSIREMEGELDKVIKASAEAMSNYNRLEAEYQKNLEASEEWKRKAKQALASGNEDLAKKALEKKTEFDQQVNALQASVGQAREIRDKLKSQVVAYKGRIEEASRNASTLIARKNAANAQKKVAKVLAGIKEGDNAFASLKRFEETVHRDEASAKAYEDLSVTPDTELNKEFAKLGSLSADDELEALRAEMAAEKMGVQKRL